GPQGVYHRVYLGAAVVEAERYAHRARHAAAVAAAYFLAQLVDALGRDVEQAHQVGVGAEAAGAGADGVLVAEYGGGELVVGPLEVEGDHTQAVLGQRGVAGAVDGEAGDAVELVEGVRGEVALVLGHPVPAQVV